jgi:hypothetical protein
MADVIRGKFGARREIRSGWGKYEAQETGEPPDSPDIERSPDPLPRPGPDNERPEPQDDGAAPPFTGEDAEDVGPPKRDRPRPM